MMKTIASGLLVLGLFSASAQRGQRRRLRGRPLSGGMRSGRTARSASIAATAAACGYRGGYGYRRRSGAAVVRPGYGYGAACFWRAGVPHLPLNLDWGGAGRTAAGKPPAARLAGR